MKLSDFDSRELLLLARTTDDRQSLTWLIEDILNLMYGKSFNIKDYLKTHLAYDTCEALEKLMQKYAILPDSTEDVEAFLRMLMQRFSLLSVVELTLSFVPTRDLLETISEWLAREYKRAVLVSIDVDKTIIGGAIVSCSGVYFDYTIKKSLEKSIHHQI